MRYYLCCSNTVDKADLLETFLTHGEAHLPAGIDNLMDHSERTTQLIHLVLHIHVHIATKTCNLEWKNFAKIRNIPSRKLVHSFVISRLDY